MKSKSRVMWATAGCLFLWGLPSVEGQSPARKKIDEGGRESEGGRAASVAFHARRISEPLDSTFFGRRPLE